MTFLDERHIQELAEKITDKYYKKDKAAQRRWGAEGREKTIYDTKWTLKRLELAVDLNDSKLFFKYIDWLIHVLLSRNVKYKVIVEHTKICLDVLKPEAKKDKSKKATKSLELFEKAYDYILNNVPEPKIKKAS